MFGNAASYERFMGRWSRLLASPLLDFANVPARGRILDVGSGTGVLSFAIAERAAGVSVLGIDPSPEYVAYARSTNPFSGRADFEVADAEQLHFPDRAFDAAVSMLAFNFIPDAKKALLELRRVTKPGETISAAVWDYGDGMRMLRIFWDAVSATHPQAAKIDEKHMLLCHAGELAALWKECGLENVREQALEIRTRFDSFADYWDPFLLGQGPGGSYVRSLPVAKADALRDEVLRRLALPDVQTPFDLPARAWAVRGAVPIRA